jgi:hypothetical protein
MQTRLKMVLAGALLSVVLPARVPATDSRNTGLHHTDFHFAMPRYATLPKWEAHKAELQRQILVAAGLYPLPEKTPLHPGISGRIACCRWPMWCSSGKRARSKTSPKLRRPRQLRGSDKWQSRG